MTVAGAHPVAAMPMAGRRRFEHVSGAAGKDERSNFDKDFAGGVRRLAAGVGWGSIRCRQYARDGDEVVRAKGNTARVRG